MNRFERIKKLGEGATGSVFKAFDNTSGILVALKVPEPMPEDIDISAHYSREIELLKSIHHEGVVTVVDSGTDDGKPWVAYEFIKGHTLRELIASGKAFTVEESLRIVRDIARALSYIHDRGIVHRDINPNNVMVTTDGAVKIMDFGIALKPGEPFLRQFAGTPGYMSPESARGEIGGPESDIYSLGLILYELLAGNPAYTGGSVPEVIGKVIVNDFPELGKRKADLPRDVVSIVEKALQNKPKDRYQSAHELAQVIDAILNPQTEVKPSQVDKSALIESTPKLVGIAGPYRSYEVELGPMITTFGREYADVNLSRDPNIAPQQCWIVPEEGAYWLYDAEDSGGTFLGGMAIKRAKLRHGDKISIGLSTFKWDNASDVSLPARSPRDIEYVPVIPRTPTGAGTQPATDYLKPHGYKQASTGGFSPVLRGFVFSILIVFFCVVIYGFVLLPNGETKKINLVLEDYWVEIDGELTRGSPEVIISDISNRPEGFKYDELESIELSSSFFFKLPGPASTRRANLNRILIAEKAMQALNAIRVKVVTSELSKEIGKYIKEIDLIALPENDRWRTRKNTILASLRQIETWLNEKALTEAEYQPQVAAGGASKEALQKFLEAYYLITETAGKPSTEIARNAFYAFQESRDKALEALDKAGADLDSKALVVLNDYFMVKLRMDSLPSWAPDIIDDSVALLTEGRDMLDEFTDAQFPKAVPDEITDDGYRVRGRLKAKYITLIDQFQRSSGATVPGGNAE